MTSGLFNSGSLRFSSYSHGFDYYSLEECGLALYEVNSKLTVLDQLNYGAKTVCNSEWRFFENFICQNQLQMCYIFLHKFIKCITLKSYFSLQCEIGAIMDSSIAHMCIVYI